MVLKMSFIEAVRKGLVVEVGVLKPLPSQIGNVDKLVVLVVVAGVVTAGVLGVVILPPPKMGKALVLFSGVVAGVVTAVVLGVKILAPLKMGKALVLFSGVVAGVAGVALLVFIPNEANINIHGFITLADGKEVGLG